MSIEPSRGVAALSDGDRADVMAAVNGLNRSLATELHRVDMSVVPEPFQATLMRHRPAVAADPADAVQGLAEVRIDSEAWVQECLARIDQVAPGRLAWREIDAEAALERAQYLDRERRLGRVHGPLHGVPVALKDMYDQRGRHSGWGSAMRDNAPPAAMDSTVAQRLEAAGAIILGTQHMAEFAMSPTGLNLGLGPGRNPWNVEHVSGGSSSGAGMSVAAGHVPLAIGSDTGGSVRLPAALCGLSGLKPTQHRISVAGVMPLSPSLDCVGPLARSVDMCAWAYAAMAGVDARDGSCLPLQAPGAGPAPAAARQLVLAVPDVSRSPLVSEAMAAAFEQARRTLSEAGVRCISVPLPDLDLTGRLGSVLLAVESAALHRQWIDDVNSGYGRQVRRRLSRGLFVSGMDYYDALRLRAPLLEAFLRDALQGADALLLPTVPGEAPRVQDTVGADESELERRFSTLSAWTRGINYLGVPGLNVPAGFSPAGLPLGIQFIGRPLGEDTLFALGRLYQSVTDWHRRTPY